MNVNYVGYLNSHHDLIQLLMYSDHLALANLADCEDALFSLILIKF